MLSKPQRSCSVQKKTKQQTQFMRISSNGGIRNVVDIRIFSVDLIFVNIPIFEHQNEAKKEAIGTVEAMVLWKWLSVNQQVCAGGWLSDKRINE